MGMPEFAKDMRVTVSYQNHVIDSSLIAWTLYERRNRDRRTNEPAVKVTPQKAVKRKRAKSLEAPLLLWRHGASSPALGGNRSAFGSLLVHHFLFLLRGFSGLMHTHRLPG